MSSSDSFDSEAEDQLISKNLTALHRFKAMKENRSPVLSESSSSSSINIQSTPSSSITKKASKSLKRKQQQHQKSITADINSDPQLNTINQDDIRDFSQIQHNEMSPPNTKKTTTASNQKKTRWFWQDEMVEALIGLLKDYKIDMEYKGLDFQADLVACYSILRKQLAQKFDSQHFGPIAVLNKDTDLMDQHELLQYKRKVDMMEKLIRDGYTRVKGKVKELRKGYKHAVDTGTRSGSGRLVNLWFDSLQEIWGGSPSVTSLEGGHISLPPPEADADAEDEEVFGCDDTNNDKEPNEGYTSTAKSNKRDHMKKKLSLHQKEMMHIDIMKQELEIKKQAVELMKESINSNTESIRMMTQSICDIGQGIKEGLGLLANSMLQCQQLSIIQNGTFSSSNMSSNNILSPPPTPR